MQRSALWLAACLCLACLAPPAAWAEIRMAADAGLANSYKAGGWTVLRVLVENRAGAGRARDFEGRLRASTTDNNGLSYSFAVELTLPVGSRKLVELPVTLPNLVNPVIVELINERGRVNGLLQLNPNHQINLDDQRRGAIIRPTVLLVAGLMDNPAFVSTAPDAANVRPILPEALPRDYKGYDGVAVVVTREGLAGQLAEEQLEALDRWLRLGGRLLVVARTADVGRDRWLAPRLPAPLLPSKNVPQSELDPNLGPEPLLLAQWGPPVEGARVLWDSPHGPLALERPWGIGRVTALSIDPAMLAGARGVLPARIRMLNESLVLGPAIEDLRARHLWATANVMPFDDTLALPNRLIVILLIGLFVIVVGPLNFRLLRQARRLELAWVTIPTLSICFFVAIYGYGVASKGGQQHYSSAEILHLTSGVSEGLLLWNGMQFSPRRETYRLWPGEAGTVMPLLSSYDNPRGSLNWNARQFTIAPRIERAPGGGRRPTALLAAGGDYQLDQPVGQWQMSYYMGERPLAIQGAIEGEVTPPAIPGGPYRIRVANRTATALTDAVVWVGPLRFMLGAINPGATLDLQLTGEETTPPPPPAEEKSDPFGVVAPPTPPGPSIDPREEIGPSRGLIEWAQHVTSSNGNTYPNLEPVHPQRRCRLLARQSGWTSQVRIDPAPEIQSELALVEVDLPLRLTGETTLETRGLLRRDVYHFATQSTTSGSIEYDVDGNWCSISGGWIDVAIGPPALAGPARLVRGQIELELAAEGHTARAYLYHYASGQWNQLALVRHDPRALQPIPPGPEQTIYRFELRPDSVNAFTPLARLRIEAVAPNQTSFGGAVKIKSLKATMTLAPDTEEAATPAPSPIPEQAS